MSTGSHTKVHRSSATPNLVVFRYISEMPFALSNGISLCYETIGSPTDPPLLLVMGLGAQMISWEDGFCNGLAAKGFYVIRYDNRDCGLSTHFDGVPVDALGAMAARLTGQPVPPMPYSLSDMADDGLGLLDHLGIDRAHIVGTSLGGMVAQTMAAEHPERFLSLTSIMSTTGEVEFFDSSPEAQESLLRVPATSKQEAMDQARVAWKITSSKRYFDPDQAAERTGREYDRMFYPEGAGRQMGAVFASGHDRVEALRTSTIPTLVIHGRDDTLIMPKGGERTAEIIPGAALLMMSDMGHDLPREQWPIVLDAIASHCRHAVATASLDA
jgi:pimeloyl-ACP methyl ester carboxylesterase